MDKTHAVEVLGRLVQLERDRLFAFDAAIEGTKDEELRARLGAIRAEHSASLGELEKAMRGRAASPQETESLHGVRIESRIGAASIVGDGDILERIAMSEGDAIDAYDGAASDEQLGEPLRTRLRSKVAEERRHREWMREWLAVHQP